MKESVYIRKEFNTLKIGLGHRRGDANMSNTLYLHTACNASPRRMEIQSNPCRSSSNDQSRRMESLQDQTRYHSAAGRMGTYCSHWERLQ